MFEPFVLDALASEPVDGLAALDVQTRVLSRHQLRLPISTVQTLLGRATKRGYLRRDGGRYFETGRRPDVGDLQESRRLVEVRQGRLADALAEACSADNVSLSTREEALSLIFDFLASHHVRLALEGVTDDEGPPGVVVADPEVPQRRERSTARFLRDTVVMGGELAGVVQEMLEGFVLQNALLLKDISTATRPFKGLRVFFDSGLLFGALGYQGQPTEVAARELLAVLRDNGATTEVFEPTIQEMRRILAVYEDRIGTSKGRGQLYPTDLTRYFVTGHYTPSDIRSVSSMLESNVRGLGFMIRTLPAHETALTLDERRLGELLAASPGGENVPRVVHDIDCVAAVLTLRKGRTAESLDEAGVVFATLSSMTLRSVTNWYAEQEDGRVMPPIVHYIHLSNLAWLKRPASASTLKTHELVALCTAALRPSREVWEAFLRHLRRLESSNELSSDEATAIIASNLTDRVLADEEIEEDADAATLSEVVDRVKAAYRAEADSERESIQAVADQREAEVLQLRLSVDSRSRALATWASWGVTGLLALSLVAGSVLTLIQWGDSTGPSGLAIFLALIPLVLLGLFGVLWGFNLSSWRRRVENFLAKRIRIWIAGAGTE